MKNHKRNLFKGIDDIVKKYRWGYIVFVAAFVGVVLNQYVYLLSQHLSQDHYWWREFCISFGQIGWQCIAITYIASSKTSRYLTNMSTVSFFGSLGLLPLLLLNKVMELNLLALGIGFAVIVCLMLLEHMRRCKTLGLPISMTISWVAYRTTVLVGIILMTFSTL